MRPSSAKLRLDQALVERGLAPSRSRAHERISSGLVSVDGVVVQKPAFPILQEQVVTLADVGPHYVSRGGIKLAAALDAWEIQVAGRNCLDIGVSTGGFADCLLQRGAAWVIGVDSGQNQLAERLRVDPRVTLLERTNARYLSPASLPAGISLVVMDVSFIAASLVLPAVIQAVYPTDTLTHKGLETVVLEAVVLVKPQFEAGREFVGKRGIVRDETAFAMATDKVRHTLVDLRAKETRLMDSPIAGGDGNREFLMYARF